ncbi:MAG TPA: hypothetical protein VEW42_03155 [Candidatus Eisenbacteria bacterium]|nr:hypothetical protein [Candidatus Eisenbacteria bacterium]
MTDICEQVWNVVPGSETTDAQGNEVSKIAPSCPRRGTIGCSMNTDPGIPVTVVSPPGLPIKPLTDGLTSANRALCNQNRKYLN